MRHQGTSKKVKKIVILLGTVGILGLLFGGPPNVSFESSDGSWGDQEVLLKGRNFTQIHSQYEQCRNEGITPDAILVRTTKINYFNLFAWPSYFRDTKWKVPYQPPRTNGFLGGFCPKSLLGRKS